MGMTTMTNDEMTTKENTMTDLREMTEIETTIATLFWQDKIAGKKRAEIAVLVWTILRDVDQGSGMTMDQILEVAGEDAEPLRDHRDGATSKLNLTARQAIKALLELGLIERRGYTYFDGKQVS